MLYGAVLSLSQTLVEQVHAALTEAKDPHESRSTARRACAK